MLDSERNSHENDIDKATGQSAGAAPAPVTPAVPAALFQPPQVLFQPPAPVAPPPGGRDSGGRDSGDRESEARPEYDDDSGRPTRTRTRGGRSQGGDDASDQGEAESGRSTGRRTRSRSRNARGRDAAADDDLFSTDSAGAIAEADDADNGGVTERATDTGLAADGEEPATSRRSRRRRNTRTRGRAEADTGFAEDGAEGQSAADDAAGDDAGADSDGDGDAAGEVGASGRKRRRKRRRPGSADSEVLSPDDPPDTVVHVREPHNPADDVRAIKGSTRLEAKKQRRREGRESGRRRPPVITESEFLARRESVERTMVVRQRGDRTQIAVLEDGVLVEHYVNRTTHASYVGNVYLGKVQNVLPSMEAAFVDIGKGRNAVLYAGEVNFDASGLEGQPKRIESALKPGQSVIVQVTKDPVGHKGARLTSQVSLPGRYLVYVPGASMTGISRKLPDTERTRLKQILKKVTPENAGVIVRTAAEGAAEAELDRDITRLAAQWANIEKKAKTANAPALLYGEPDLTIRVIRDVFNEDFNKLIVSGDEGWEIIDEYVRYVAPHLADRISRWEEPDSETAFSRDGHDDDVFAAYRIDEQLAKALERKVWLPSGGSLVIDRTEAMTVIDVNTGKFTGQGGNLEETVTRNNLEAAEEIVRQLRLRDVGGIVVIDFIDMVLESNRELVLRRLLECLARDRTKHQVAEVTSLGLVQMTRKRVGAGLLEAFSQQCECCNGRGVIITLDAPAEPVHRASAGSGSVSTGHRPVPTPPAHAPANGNGSGRPGHGNGRRARRDEERNARDAAPATATETETETAQAGTAQLDAVAVGVAEAGTANDAPGDTAAPSDSGAATESDANGTRRTRRSTSAGTAFATAVVVEDTPPVVPVVTTVPPVTEPAPSGFTPVVTGDPAAEPAEPPVRRTRSGSAVARVTVVTEPEPAAAPAETPAPEQEPAAAEATAPQADAVVAPTETVPAANAPADTAPTHTEGLTGDLEAPEADALEQAAEVQASAEPEPTAVLASQDPEVPTADALEQAAEVQASVEPEPTAVLASQDLEAPEADVLEQSAEVLAPAPEETEAAEEAVPAPEAAEAAASATESFAPSTEPTESEAPGPEATESEAAGAEAAEEAVPAPEATASLTEPAIVPASLFDLPATESADTPAAPAAEGEADPAPVALTETPAPEHEVAAQETAAAPEAAAEREAATEQAAAAEQGDTIEATPADESSVVAVAADGEGEVTLAATPGAPAADPASEAVAPEAEGEASGWA